jgi:DNA-binding transcriptional LysR family regulator
VAVVEEGGVSAAARSLHMSQPAITQTIQSLEKRLGVKLLERARAGVTATSAGMTLYAEARTMIAAERRAAALMQKHSTAADSGVLRIGIPLELPAEVLTRPLARLASEFPATTTVALHMSSARQIAALNAGELEFGLVRERPVSSHLDAILVLDEELGVLLAAHRPTRGAHTHTDGIGLETLSDLAWLGFPRSCSPGWYDEVMATLRSHGVSMRCSTADVTDPIPEVKFAAVSSGRLFALAPASWRGALPEAIRWHRLIGGPLRRRTWATWSAGSQRRDLAYLVTSLRADDQTKK